MATERNGKPKADEELEIEFDEDDVDDDEPVVAVGNAIVEVAFGEPEEEGEEIERIINWVESFEPGLLTRQVADLFVSHGNVCIMMDRETVTVPLRSVRLLLEQAEIIKED